MAGKRRVSFEEEQHALTEAAASPRSDEARARLVAGLRSGRSLVAARAARLIKEHRLEGFDEELEALFTRLLPDPVKSDPVCSAKLAAIEALDYLESMDPAPFVRASVHVQHEPSDTAAPMRARAVLALARIGHDELDLVAARRATTR